MRHARRQILPKRTAITHQLPQARQRRPTTLAVILLREQMQRWIHCNILQRIQLRDKGMHADILPCDVLVQREQIDGVDEMAQLHEVALAGRHFACPFVRVQEPAATLALDTGEVLADTIDA